MIELREEAIEAMRRHAAACAPEEACGLLGGRGDRVHMVYCLDNIDRSPVRFTVDPTGHMGALRHAEANGWDLIGAFHSHPSGPAVPSQSDIAGALEPTWYHVIVTRRDLGAFRIEKGRARRVDIHRPVPGGGSGHNITRRWRATPAPRRVTQPEGSVGWQGSACN